MLRVSLRLSQTLTGSRAKVPEALLMQRLISVSIDAFNAIYKHKKLLTYSMHLSSRLIVGGIYFPWLRTLVFLRLMVRQNLSMLTKTDLIVFEDLGQSELRVQHYQQRADLVW